MARHSRRLARRARRSRSFTPGQKVAMGLFAAAAVATGVGLYIHFSGKTGDSKSGYTFKAGERYQLYIQSKGSIVADIPAMQAALDGTLGKGAFKIVDVKLIAGTSSTMSEALIIMDCLEAVVAHPSAGTDVTWDATDLGKSKDFLLQA